MPDSQTRDPAEIELEIKRTQRDMSDTVNRLSDQFTPRNILNGLLDKADEGGFDTRMLIDQARRNPLALAMIGGGALWLISDADARPSAFTSSDSSTKQRGSTGSSDQHNRYHGGYVEHMGRVEPRADEDDQAYRRRRNHARASYLMLEQRHEEDDKSFSQRLDEATDTMREARVSMTELTASAGKNARSKGRDLSRRAIEAYKESPIVGGLAAAIVGAIAGATLPLSETEDKYLGSAGEKVLTEAEAKVRDLADTAREKKDDLVDDAEMKLQTTSTGSV